MGNMSYCRWENTSDDMADCVASMDGLDINIKTMSSHERSGVLRALRLAAEMLENAPLELLAEAGIDMERLPTQESIQDAAEAEA